MQNDYFDPATEGKKLLYCTMPNDLLARVEKLIANIKNIQERINAEEGAYEEMKEEIGHKKTLLAALGEEKQLLEKRLSAPKNADKILILNYDLKKKEIEIATNEGILRAIVEYNNDAEIALKMLKKRLESANRVKELIDLCNIEEDASKKDGLLDEIKKEIDYIDKIKKEASQDLLKRKEEWKKIELSKIETEKDKLAKWARQLLEKSQLEESIVNKAIKDWEGEVIRIKGEYDSAMNANDNINRTLRLKKIENIILELGNANMNLVNNIQKIIPKGQKNKQMSSYGDDSKSPKQTVVSEEKKEEVGRKITVESLHIYEDPIKILPANNIPSKEEPEERGNKTRTTNEPNLRPMWKALRELTESLRQHQDVPKQER